MTIGVGDGERVDVQTGQVRGYLPRSVRRCIRGRYTLLRWRVDHTGMPTATGYECSSWRCPKCRRKVAASDFVRLQEGIRKVGDWVYLVLTCDRDKYRSKWAAWNALGHSWRDRLRHRLTRAYGPVQYVQTWEQTRAGWPHVNVLVSGARLLAEVDALGWREGRNGRVLAWRRVLRSQAQASGFGRVVWVDRLWVPTPERPDPHGSLAAYFVGLAAELGDHTAKAEQTPTEAPPGFRRMRCSPKLLPPRRLGRATEPGKWARMIVPGPVEPWTWERLNRYVARHGRSTPRPQGNRVSGLREVLQAVETAP